MTLPKLTEQQTYDLGERGRQLLSDPAFNRAVAALAQAYWDEWRASAPADVEGRETLYLKAQLLDDVIVSLGRVVGDGKVVADIRSKAKVRPIR